MSQSIPQPPAVPPVIPPPSGAVVMKWMGFLVTMAAGIYLIFVKGDPISGIQAVGFALWIGGATATLQKINLKQASITEDLSDIKASPNLPGVPLGSPTVLDTKHPH